MKRCRGSEFRFARKLRLRTFTTVFQRPNWLTKTLGAVASRKPLLVEPDNETIGCAQVTDAAVLEDVG